MLQRLCLLLLLLPVAAATLGACAARTPEPGAPAAAAVTAVPDPLASARQLVVVTTGGWEATTGELRRFVRAAPGDAWRAEGGAVPIVVGRTGLAWGVGFDAHAERTATAGPTKREGDGRAPAGSFPLATAFGFAPAGAVTTGLPYLQLTPTIECVDDTASTYYNGIVERLSVPAVDWNSAERMRQVAQYRLGVVVDYNPRPAAKGRGSCIFLHVWAGPRSTTVGCTALDESELARLIGWLDARALPVIVQLPAPVYEHMRPEWALPPLR